MTMSTGHGSRWLRALAVAGALAGLSALLPGCGSSAGWDATKGIVTVTILPAEAVTAGAKWTIDADTTQRNSGDTLGNLDVGAHTIRFVAVTGWTTPADQPVTLTAGNTSTVTGTYVVGPVAPGSVRVTITPSAAAAGAKWTLDSDATQHNSGETVASVTAGSHTVKFTEVAGFTTPADQTVTVVSGQTLDVTGAYVQPGTGPAVARFSTGNYTAGTAFQVTITITAAIGAQGWAAEDKVPTGWTAANVSGGGTWDAVNGKMKWVSTDTIDASNQTKTVVYSVTPPAGTTGTATFVGTYSSGGTPQAITGDRVIAP